MYVRLCSTVHVYTYMTVLYHIHVCTCMWLCMNVHVHSTCMYVCTCMSCTYILHMYVWYLLKCMWQCEIPSCVPKVVSVNQIYINNSSFTQAADNCTRYILNMTTVCYMCTHDIHWTSHVLLRCATSVVFFLSMFHFMFLEGKLPVRSLAGTLGIRRADIVAVLGTRPTTSTVDLVQRTTHDPMLVLFLFRLNVDQILLHLLRLLLYCSHEQWTVTFSWHFR